jgi:hypothetical protein
MQKRKLVVEEIEIASFEVSGDVAERGTVEGNQLTAGTDSCRDTCVNYSCAGATCTVVMC